MRENHNSNRNNNMGVNLEPLDISIPWHFRCPISLELMRDPVTVSTGQTYDRPSIDSWILAGNTTCPVTRSPLSDVTLIPNHTLRRLIQNWCDSNRAFGFERIPTPTQPADPAEIRILLNQAGSDRTAFPSRIAALSRLKRLACDSDKNRSLIGSYNATEILLRIVFSDCNDELKQEALAILVNFSIAESECVLIASETERVQYLTSLLFHNSIDVRVNSAAMIEIVLSVTRSPELRLRISNADKIHDGVVDILRSPISYPRGFKIGIKALFALCLPKETRRKAVVAGAAKILVDRLADLEKSDAERALATIELLCRIPEGRSAFEAYALTVPVLVKIILKVSDRATEHAAGSLVSLCSESESCRREAVAAHVLTQLLLLVQSECTERGKRKAKMLLKLLRDSWPQHYSVANSDDFACTEGVLPF